MQAPDRRKPASRPRLADLARISISSEVASIIHANDRPLSRSLKDLNCWIAVDVGTESFGLKFARGKVCVEAQGSGKPEATVSGNRDTIIDLVSGRESGIQAYLDGRLQVRGNLALVMKLQSLFEDPELGSRSFRTGYTRAAGIRTFYLEAGEGTPLILLHGLGATSASMLPAFWDLAKDHRVIAPDLPGFGESGKPVRAYNASFFGRWLLDLLDVLDVGKAHLVGNSMGGRIAIEAALQAPERVDRLVLLAPSLAFIKGRQFAPLVKLFRSELALLPLFVSRKRLTMFVRSMFSKPSRLPDSWYDSAVDEFLRTFSSPRGRTALFSAGREIYLESPYGEHGFWDRLAQLERPALFIWGAKDILVPVGFAKHVQKALPNSKSMIFNDCGHIPQFELPDRTNAAIRSFLGSV